MSDTAYGAEALRHARRVVVKVGSSSLTTPTGGIDETRVLALVDSLAAARKAGLELVLVSSGAIAAGLAPLGFGRRPRDLARQQAAASVGQGLLVHRYTDAFAAHGIRVGQILLTADDVTRRAHVERRSVRRSLRSGSLSQLKRRSSGSNRNRPSPRASTPRAPARRRPHARRGPRRPAEFQHLRESTRRTPHARRAAPRRRTARAPTPRTTPARARVDPPRAPRALRRHAPAGRTSSPR